MQPKYERLTDDQWEVIKEFVNWQRKRKLDLRDVFDAIFFVVRTGIQWRNLKDTNLPDWQVVYYYFDNWKKDGTWREINVVLNRIEQLQKGQEALPSLGLTEILKASNLYHLFLKVEDWTATKESMVENAIF